MTRAVWVTSLCVAVLLVGALGLVALWFFAAHELREEVEETGLRSEAKRNPLLAAERFTAAMGVPSVSRRTMFGCPPPDHAIVLTAPRESFGALRTAEVLAWVEAGGHLIVTPARSLSQGIWDPILDEIGIETRVLDENWEPAEDENREPGVPKDERIVLAAQPAGAGRTLRVAAYDPVVLEDTLGVRSWAVSEGTSFNVVRCSLGAGSITVLADATFLTNEHIGAHDHAELLWRLLDYRGTPAGVWFVRSDEMPHILALIAGQGWPALLAAAVLLALCLWRAGGRFGPLLPAVPPARRSLREHLDAAGRFLWRHGARRVLLGSVRRSVSERAALRRPDWSKLPPERQVRYLSEQSGLGAARIERALTENGAGDPNQFALTVRVLEHLRRSIGST